MSRYNGGQVDMSNYYNNLIEEANWNKNLTPPNGVWDLVYGFDHACGYFVQFFPVDSISKTFVMKYTGNEDSCIDIDSVFNRLTGVKLGYFLKIAKVNEEHQNLCFMDLPF